MFCIVILFKALCDVWDEEIKVMDDTLLLDNLPHSQLAPNVQHA